MAATKKKALLLLIGAMLSIQLGASLAKQSFDLAPPPMLTFMRCFIAAILLNFLFKPWRRKYTQSERLILGVYGCSLGFMNLLFYCSLQRIALGLAVVVEFIGPLLLAILSSRHKRDWLLALLAAAGVWLIVPIKQEHSVDLIGVLYALAAGFFWALYIVFAKKLAHRIPTRHAISAGMTAAALACLPFSLGSLDATILSWDLLRNAVTIALLSSALPYSLELMATKSLSTKSFGILMSLEPLLAALIGFVFLNEVLSLTQFLAVGLIIIASLSTCFFKEPVQELKAENSAHTTLASQDA